MLSRLRFLDNMDMMIRQIIITCLVLICCLPGIAQITISLDSCLMLAVQNRSKIKALSQDQLIAALKTADLRAKYWPQVSLNYDYRYNPVIQTSIIPIGQFYQQPTDEVRPMRFGTKWQQNAGAVVYQPLLDASIASQVAESKIQERLKQLDVENAENELRYEVVKTYASIWLNLNQVKDNELDTLRTHQSVQLMKARLEEGRLLKTEFNNAVINHNRAREGYEVALTELIKQIAYLGYLTSVPVEILLRAEFETDSFGDLLTQHTLSPINTAGIGAINTLIGQNELLQQQIVSERRKNSLTLGLDGFIGANHFSNVFNPVAANSWFMASYLGLSVKWNLLNGENKMNRLKQLSLQKNSVDLQIVEQEELTKKNQFALEEDIRVYRQQLLLTNENIELMKENLQIFLERYEAGKIEANEINSMEIDLQKEIIKQQETRLQLVKSQLERLYISGNLEQIVR